jgi:predicted transglutaminase-like cysteine proteinase
MPRLVGHLLAGHLLASPRLGSPVIRIAARAAIVVAGLVQASNAQAMALPRAARHGCDAGGLVPSLFATPPQPASSASTPPLSQGGLARIRAQQEGRTGFAAVGFAVAKVGLPQPSFLDLDCAPGAIFNGLASISSRMILPTSSAPPAVSEATRSPNVFGSLALPLASASLKGRWQSARGSDLSTLRGPWSALLRMPRDGTDLATIDRANRWVNRTVHFVADKAGPGGAVSDHWAKAEDTLRTGKGDCEDYAIAKMGILRALGIAQDDLFLVVMRDRIVREDHMVLVVRSGGRFLALDNRTDRILDAAAAQDYRPIMSFSGDRTWLHGFSTTTAPIAEPAG